MSRFDDLLVMIDEAGVAPGLGSLGHDFRMEQSPVELAYFLDFCLERGVHSMLELGTGMTGGLQRFCVEYLHWDVTSIDERTPTIVSGRFILGRTGDEAVYAQVRDERFDLVFIDADHSYESVTHDYEWYAPLASKIVAMHDVAEGRDGCEGSAQFWGLITETTGAGGIGTIIDPSHPIGIGWYAMVQAGAHE